ncbi:MAG: SNF2 helicase associated domain-containing protein, partial [Oscillospiraceae bacterium]|nr:SNF2 helicase associated domain-containing protein [Oscillospiraceae bacterium]
RICLTLSDEGEIRALECSCRNDGPCAHEAAFLIAVAVKFNSGEDAENSAGKCLFSDHGFSSLCAEYIATASRGRETPAVAKRIAEMERVEDIKEEVLGDKKRIRARVGGHNRFSKVFETAELTLDRRGLPESGRCGCMPDGGAFLCEHMAAILLTLFPEDAAPEVVSSDAVARLIASAAPLRNPMTASGTLKLVPELNFSYGSRLTVSFLVGKDKLFSVRSISEFLDAVRSGETLAYGKNTVFDHSIESFTEEAREYIRFLRSRRGDEFPVYGRSAAAATLNENNIDDFFSLFKGKRITLNGKEVEIVNRDPEFSLLFSPAGRSGCKMNYDGEELCLLGAGEKSYILAGGNLYICGREFSKITTGLISDLSNAGSEGLLISGADIRRFFSRVVRPMREYVSWRFSDPALEARFPLELFCRINISVDGADNARAEGSFYYGEKVFPLFERIKDTDLRDIAREARIERAVLKYFPHMLPGESAAEIISDSAEVFALVRYGLDELRSLVEVEFTTSAPPRIRQSADIRFSLDLSGGLLNVDLASGEYTARELASVLTALDRGESFVRFDDGSYADLDDGVFTEFSELIRGLTLTPEELADNMKLPLFRMLYLDAAARERGGIRFDRTSAFRRAAGSSEFGDAEQAGLSVEFAKLLRPYQEEGFLWMRSLEARGFGGILADDMGLGKTVQALALVMSSPPKGAEGKPVLVVCPTSLVANWAAETRRFAPELSLCIVSGTAAERVEAISRLPKSALGITSYDSLKRDLPYYKDVTFRAVIADEAQYIKNRATQAANAVKSLSSAVKFALTGTPVENSPSELWSIFDYLMPGYLGRYSDFRRTTELPIAEGDNKALLRLRKQTSPFILRRVKRDVLSELPEKTESVLYTELSGEQRKAYAAVSATLVAEIREKLKQEAPEAGIRFDVLTMLLRLRQICCHPPLCLGEGYVGESSKLELCMELLARL